MTIKSAAIILTKRPCSTQLSVCFVIEIIVLHTSVSLSMREHPTDLMPVFKLQSLLCLKETASSETFQIHICSQISVKENKMLYCRLP